MHLGNVGVNLASEFHQTRSFAEEHLMFVVKVVRSIDVNSRDGVAERRRGARV